MLPSQVKSQVAAVASHFASTPRPNGEIPGENPVDPTDTVVAPVIPPVVAQTDVVPKAELEKVQQQLRSLQGIHKSIDTDRAALRAQVATLKATVDTLTQQVEQFKLASSPVKHLSPEEIEQYTPALLDVVGKKAREEFEPLIATLNATVQNLTNRNAQLEQALSGVVVDTAKVSTRSFLDDIQSLMPDYSKVNDDPRFMDWLQQPSPLTGRPYAVDFYDARDQKDAARIVEFFRMFSSVFPESPPPKSQPLAPPPASPPPLSELVAPGAGENVPPGPAPNGRIWTQKAIADFYKDKAAGRYANNPTLASTLEADLFKAQSENRVRA
jgi:hypothetical protein